MEPDKSRGLKHIKDKRRYKGNTTKNPKYVPPKLTPNLESNWYRYEDKEVADDQNVLAADADFTILADAPIAKGKHFQTKNDKLLAKETEATTLSELFTLNLEKLEESLMTIPFYERMGIDKTYFAESQINIMNTEAEEYLKKFKEKNKSKDPESPAKTQIEKPKEVAEELEDDSNKSEDSLQDLDEELVVNVDTNEKSKTNDEELEKWLDDFLNE